LPFRLAALPSKPHGLALTEHEQTSSANNMGKMGYIEA
jgi:hypothetical protein